MNTRWENTLYQLGSWLLIDMAIALGYWQMGGWKNFTHELFNGSWILPGSASLIAVTLGMMIFGVYLRLLCDEPVRLLRFVIGLIVLMLLLRLMELETLSWIFLMIGSLVPQFFLSLFPIGDLVRGLMPILILFSVIFQIVLTGFYLWKSKEIRWGLIAVKLAFFTLFLLTCLYPDTLVNVGISFLDWINGFWFAEFALVHWGHF
ncbi:hypothetical protein [Holdemania massiliensis]|uniref:hypothetical protein n=1 Tax=Holdemania massiliensis TaxID=1468449 RepID=UPI001F06966D|nr:hypothetical protein [Holdemania massiliensis]MCH1939138.1 hypothetical protein [Holdemania massiliensis]